MSRPAPILGRVYSDVTRPPLDVPALRRSLVTGPVGLLAALDVEAETGSTNAEALARARAGAPDLSVLVAEHQTAGRGRLGRVWTAPPRSQVALSLLLRRGAVAPALFGWLPLVTGLAVRDAVVEAAGVEAGLKWPNDVLVDGRKLAGILVEATTVDGGGDFALRLPAMVIGVGLNVSLTREELPVPHATSLALEGGSTDRDTLVRALVRAMVARVGQWRACDHGSGSTVSPELRRDYLDACTTLGSDVRVAMPDGSDLTGRCVTVDPEGRLVVRTAAGDETAVAAGDVTHVRPRETDTGGA